MDDYPSANLNLNAIKSVRTWMNRYVKKNHLNSYQRLKGLVEQA